jgi:hypothetical protein
MLVYLEVYQMPWVKISSEAHKDMKQYLVDIEGMNLGDLVEALLTYAMENLEDFEKFLDLDETEEDNEDLDQEDKDETEPDSQEESEEE